MSGRIKSPCKGCEERKEACWDTCEKYKKFSEAHRAQQKALTEWKEQTYRDRMGESQKRLGKELAKKRKPYEQI